MNHAVKERTAKNNYSCVIIIRKTAIFLGVCMGKAYLLMLRNNVAFFICGFVGVASPTISRRSKVRRIVVESLPLPIHNYCGTPINNTSRSTQTSSY